MARAQVEFAFAQQLDWQPDAAVPDFGTLPAKLLSHDLDGEEATRVVRLPAGYRIHFETRFEVELYMLDGALELNGVTLRRDGYAAVGRGAPLDWSSPTGAVLLLWQDDSEETEPGSVDIKDVLNIPWDPAKSPPRLEYMTPRTKTLKLQRGSGMPRTFLFSTMPQNYPPDWRIPEETHPCAEEMFMLGGDISGPRGVMRQGAYFWRPKQTLHGPFASRDGGLSVIRFRDGHHVNEWQQTPVPFRYDCPYDPILPQGYAVDTRRTIALDQRY